MNTHQVSHLLTSDDMKENHGEIPVIINEDIHSTVKKLAVNKDKKISDVYEEILIEGLRIISNQSNLEDYELKVE